LVIDLEARQGDKAEDMLKWKDLTPNQRIEGLLAFSESDHPKCSEREFEQWILSYHRERLNPEGALCAYDSPTSENK
jgi:hypothetical protein